MSPVLLLPLMFLWNRVPLKSIGFTSAVFGTGVQLVNAVIDLIEGYVATAILQEVLFGDFFIVYCCWNGFEYSNFGINNFY